jgi:hypothetical protein
MLLVAAGAALDPQATLRRAPERAARARELLRPGAHVEVPAPVIAGAIKRIMDALPRGALGFLEKDAHVPPLVGDLRSSAEMLGDGGKQLVCAPSRARHVDHDGSERHQSRS